MNYTFLGFTTLWDKPVDGIEKVMKELKEMDIKLVMLTGDHPSVA